MESPGVDERVVRIITRLNVGGPARHAITLDRELRSHGFAGTLVSGAESEREGRIEPGSGTDWIRLPTMRRALDPLGDVRSFRALRRMIRSRRPSIVHTHMAKAGTLGRLAARREGVKTTIHTFHGHVLAGYFARPIERVFLEAERRLARRTTALVAVSAYIRDELLGLGIGRPSQWHVIPEVVELDQLLASRLDRRTARERLGLPAAGPVIGIVGRLVAIKDHATFFAAATRVAQERADATFLVAGDGELRVQLEAEAKRNLGERVRFLGWVQDLEVLYRSLDVLVLTSRNEGLPFVLLEAAAAGRPVVATRVGGVPEAVGEGATGRIVEPGDAEGIARAALEVLLSPQLEEEAIRRWVSERFSTDRVVDQVAALYRSLLAEPAT